MDVFKLQAAVDRYIDLPLGATQVIATYIFTDVWGRISSKSRTLNKDPRSPDDVPHWDFCVNDVKNSEVLLRPVALFRDPFLRDPHKLVLCEEFRDGKPFGPGGRFVCRKVLERCAEQKLIFGMEQEYTLLDLDGHPFMWPKFGQPVKKADSWLYLYGVGLDRVYGRPVSDAHYLACLYAGVEICGSNAEGTPAQWEYQIGPCKGIAIGDHMIISRYILLRCSEDFGVKITFDPRPIEGGWGGSGCHLNVSTEATRNSDGLKFIEQAIEKLSLKHKEHLKLYDPNGGLDNEPRLKNGDYCPKLDEFTAGVGDRSASVRIPRRVFDEGRGYFEDRRPASNCNPYDVARRMAMTICLNE